MELLFTLKYERKVAIVTQDRKTISVYYALYRRATNSYIVDMMNDDDDDDDGVNMRVY